MELFIVNSTKNKDKEEPTLIISNSNNKIIDLKKLVINKFSLKISESRVGLFINDPSKANELEKGRIMLRKHEKSLRDYGVTDKMVIYIKDLGPQVGWRFTYIVEYIGPLFIITSLFLLLGPDKANTTQKLAFVMSTFHFLKRILESIFVHQFSNSTMPLKNLIINCIYYWVLYGIFCGCSIFNEGYVEPSYNVFLHYFSVFLFFSAELKNLKCHLILKELKAKNNGEKGIPHGEGFEFVSCANYFWEFLAWLFFSCFVMLIPFFLFTLIGFMIMKSWAQKKHIEYLRAFPFIYPKKRKAIIPFLI